MSADLFSIMPEAEYNPGFSFDALYKNMLNFEGYREEPRYEIRTSAMPFCPIAFLMKSYDEIMQGSNFVSNYNSTFFCDVGTTIHESIQRWLPEANPGMIFGNWRCERCGFTENYKFGPRKCPKCSKSMFYKELSLLFYDAPITGHVDGLILDPGSAKYNGKLINLWVLEYKSTSERNVKNLAAPYVHHRIQAGMYVSALRRLFHYRWHRPIYIKGFIIKYLSRDSPRSKSTDFFYRVEHSNRMYHTMCALVNKTYSSIIYDTPNRLRTMDRPCSKNPDIYEEGCQWQDLCHSLSEEDFMDIFYKVRKVVYPLMLNKSAVLAMPNTLGERYPDIHARGRNLVSLADN